MLTLFYFGKKTVDNPQDWAYQKVQEKNGAYQKDYANANMEPKQIVLSTIWAGIVVVFAYDAITGVAEGRYGGLQENNLFSGNVWDFSS